MIQQFKKAPWWVWVLFGVFVLIVIGAIAGSASGGDDDEASANAPTVRATERPADTAAPDLPSNQKKIGNLLLTVNGVGAYTDDLFPAEPGTHYVAIDVSAQNVGDEQYALNVNNFRLQDSDGFAGTYALSSIEPSIGHHELVPGQSVRGYIVFKLGDGRDPAELQYQSFTGTPGTITLR